jgi:hypothetical protein
MNSAVLFIVAAASLPAIWELQYVSKRHGWLLGLAAAIVVFVGLYLWLYVLQLMYALILSGRLHPVFTVSQFATLVALPLLAAIYIWRRSGLAAGVFAAVITSGLVWFVFAWIGISIWGL